MGALVDVVEQSFASIGSPELLLDVVALRREYFFGGGRRERVLADLTAALPPAKRGAREREIRPDGVRGEIVFFHEVDNPISSVLFVDVRDGVDIVVLGEELEQIVDGDPRDLLGLWAFEGDHAVVEEGFEAANPRGSVVIRHLNHASTR
ncbi:unknown (plasmid) [Halobacterium salinarum NRC-1]|uniref:Spurious ORF n=1 Tax=Halobacterium salinarum (strain ATCC 700922 / JCM 11081 / NRC-1) TaxID=64091 RepID=O54605_HALSA|nr:unknown [Halobacterium salinarum NRC-1]AAC82936.1 unknown [Halobacterium salinarum NRC-1]DAC79535.1 TPA_inf: spurious ORF [Halobacterium salinarum NRC-1]DAC79650.1 TPA_inf: spurious ORF [Halobacterium salinarum NRC-1]